LEKLVKRLLRGGTAAIAGLVVLLGGCSGDAGSKDAAGQPPNTDTSVPAEGTASPNPVDAAGTSTTTPGPTSSTLKPNTFTTQKPGSSGVTPEQHNNPDNPTPLEVTLAHECVKAGGTQTITIKTAPKGGAGYDSYYSDGKSGTSKDFYGGNKASVIDDTGTWSDTWTISPHAPAGPVKVVVQAARIGYKASTTERFFNLVTPAGTCG
jgi:hypothetical protein